MADGLRCVDDVLTLMHRALYEGLLTGECGTVQQIKKLKTDCITNMYTYVRTLNAVSKSPAGCWQNMRLVSRVMGVPHVFVDIPQSSPHTDSCCEHWHDPEFCCGWVFWMAEDLVICLSVHLVDVHQFGQFCCMFTISFWGLFFFAAETLVFCLECFFCLFSFISFQFLARTNLNVFLLVFYFFLCFYTFLFLYFL